LSRNGKLPQTSFGLPDHKHLPGKNQRHPEDTFDHVKEYCLKTTSDATAAENKPWLYGLQLINHGFYWEAHEVLEEVWMRAVPNSREKWLLQCVIHLANGSLKLELALEQAAIRLALLADECRSRAFAGEIEVLMGLSKDDLAKDCQMLGRAKPIVGFSVYS